MSDSIKNYDVTPDEVRRLLAEQGVSLDAAEVEALIEFVNESGGVVEAREALTAFVRLAA